MGPNIRRMVSTRSPCTMPDAMKQVLLSRARQLGYPCWSNDVPCGEKKGVRISFQHAAMSGVVAEASEGVLMVKMDLQSVPSASTEFAFLTFLDAFHHEQAIYEDNRWHSYVSTACGGALYGFVVPNAWPIPISMALSMMLVGMPLHALWFANFRRCVKMPRAASCRRVGKRFQQMSKVMS